MNIEILKDRQNKGENIHKSEAQQSIQSNKQILTDIYLLHLDIKLKVMKSYHVLFLDHSTPPPYSWFFKNKEGGIFLRYLFYISLG